LTLYAASRTAGDSVGTVLEPPEEVANWVVPVSAFSTWIPAGSMRNPQTGAHADTAADVAVGLRRLAGDLPPEFLGALDHALFQPGGRVGLAPAYLAHRRYVFEPQLDGIHADRHREIVHHLFERPRALRVSRRTKGPAGPGVDVDQEVFAFHIGTGVEILDQPVVEAGAALGKCAGGAEAGKFKGGQGALFRDPGLEPNVDSWTVAGHQHCLLAGGEELDRSCGHLSEQARENGGSRGLELGAEPAAHVGVDYAHIGERQTEDAGVLLLDREHSLQRLPHRETVAVPLGDAAVELHGRVDLILHVVGALENDLGGGETGLHVAPLVAVGIAGAVAAVVDRGRPVRERVALVGNRRQHVVLDLDGAKRVSGLLRGLGGDRGDRLPFEATGFGQQRHRVRTAVERPPYIPHLGGGGNEYGLDAGHGFGGRGVDLLDLSVGVR